MKIVAIEYNPIFGAQHRVVKIPDLNQQRIYKRARDKKSALLLQRSKQK